MGRIRPVSPVDLSPVGLDPTDAVEIAEACEFLAQWLRTAPPAVAASLDRFVARPGFHHDMGDDLIRFAELLMAARPVAR